MTPRKRRNRAHYALMLLTIGLIVCCVVLCSRSQHQLAMDRDLIESLKIGDFSRASALVDAGADPDTRVLLPPTPTLPELLNQLFNPSSRRLHSSATAFMVVCGDAWVTDIKTSRLIMLTMPEKSLDDPALDRLAQKMIAHGAHINATDEGNWTALMIATYSNLTNRMRLLLDQGAEIDHRADDGDTALLKSIRMHHPEALKLLLKYHANPNLTDSNGTTPLSLANRYRYPSPTGNSILGDLRRAGATH